MDYLRPTIFGIVMLLYLWYPYSMIQGQEEILEKGTSYRFQPRPVDPVDAFRGRYVVLGYDGMTMDIPNANQSFKHGQTLYVRLEKDTAGLAYFSSVHSSKPSEGDYITTVCSRLNKDKLSFRVPENMNRYFLNEAIAPEAERLYRNLNRRSNRDTSFSVYIDTKVYEGQIRMEQLYFNEQTVEDYIRAQSSKK